MILQAACAYEKDITDFLQRFPELLHCDNEAHHCKMCKEYYPIYFKDDNIGNQYLSSMIIKTIVDQKAIEAFEHGCIMFPLGQWDLFRTLPLLATCSNAQLEWCAHVVTLAASLVPFWGISFDP